MQTKLLSVKIQSETEPGRFRKTNHHQQEPK